MTVKASLYSLLKKPKGVEVRGSTLCSVSVSEILAGAHRSKAQKSADMGGCSLVVTSNHYVQEGKPVVNNPLFT